MPNNFGFRGGGGYLIFVPLFKLFFPPMGSHTWHSQSFPTCTVLCVPPAAAPDNYTIECGATAC